MHRKAMTLAWLGASAVAVGATLAPDTTVRNDMPVASAASPILPAARPPMIAAPAPVAPSSEVSSALARWNSLRQSDNLPFSSYASFLTRYRDWPGETAMRKSAERAIDPDSSSPAEVVAFFRLHAPLTPVGHARHAFALAAQGRSGEAREAARKAWTGGLLPRSDEDRLLGLFGSSLSQTDHDRRMEKLLANRDTVTAARLLSLTSATRQPIFSTRLALLGKASDASARLGALGSLANSDAGLLMDRARWLRDSGQSAAARSLMAQPRQLSAPPVDAETWLENLLLLARGAAADRNWQTAYQIASQLDDVYAPGTDINDQSVGERDDYTSLAWLAGTTALHQLGRPADAARMFARYARGGRSSQVLTKGLYWAGRAAQQAGQNAQATTYFEEAAAFPELFYGQLALERLGRAVPAPLFANLLQPSAADRAAFERKEVVQATRLLGQLGSWNDQSLFIRNLAETSDDPIERTLASSLALQLGRPDLSVWVARSARNGGTPFYTRAGYPEARIPAAQSQYWSLANGIIRQESSFDRAAMSPVGARGMMQLMPGTAREVSGKLGLSYDLGRLTSDPEHNIQLGSHYFAGLMNSWGGSAPLAVASYNAGPGNVRKWIREYGDPRLPGVDIIRWIEDIPFSETRGYVQRVLENAVVYDTMNPNRAQTPATTRLSSYLGKSGRPG
ncbi:MAG TPA: lytic transglycosylase domain-containing protein [Allosphingosinicella sp.]|uniref:lytic transglycosylase domain-containing protein n=1 Tax=Allosphingosinicella sp. TaxID=2823234 RepID=UPI002F299E15